MARPDADGEAAGLGLAAGGEAVEPVLLVLVEGLDAGEMFAVGLLVPPPRVQAPAKSAVAARNPAARPHPLIFCRAECSGDRAKCTVLHQILLGNRTKSGDKASGTP